MSDISLNPEQKRAVEHTGGPLLIVAGAGTGKTTVITERIRWLINEQKVKPQSVLALTFTEKAAQEMLGRVDEVMPLGYEEPWLSTFHSFADRILREEALEIGLDPAYKIMTRSDQWLFLRQHLFDFDLDYYRPLGNPTKFISALLTLFSRAQDECVGPEEFLGFAEKGQALEEGDIGSDPFEDSRSPPETQPNGQNRVGPSGKKDRISSRWTEVARAYEKYQQLKIEESKLDFGDLILWSLRLFQERPNILEKYQQQFRHILVDEFQDTNYAQYQLVKLLAPAEAHPNLVVVGDDDQSIYKFRGASVSNILEFKDDYPGARTVVLDKNYRSTQTLLDAAYGLIQNNNPDRLEEKLGIGKRLVSYMFSEKGNMGSDPLGNNGPLRDPASGRQNGVRPLIGPYLLPQLLVAETAEREAERVVGVILDLMGHRSDFADKGSDPFKDSGPQGGPALGRQQRVRPCVYSSFAILARANNHLDPFVAALRRAGIPYQLVGNRGLFNQEEIVYLMSLLRVVANVGDNVSLYHLLVYQEQRSDPNREKVGPESGKGRISFGGDLEDQISSLSEAKDLISNRRVGPSGIPTLLQRARKARKPLWEMLPEDNSLRQIILEAQPAAVRQPVTRVLYNLLLKLKFMEPYLEEESVENELRIKNTNLFFERVKRFESEADNPSVFEFIDYLDLLLEAGEDPAQAEIEDVDTVKLTTVHAAKGLEFPVVFLVNLISSRFPTRRRGDPIPLPDELIKESLPEGDSHLQEERRLFYVGCTRAKERLFLTYAENYGGKRKCHPSGFIGELGLVEGEDRGSGGDEGDRWDDTLRRDLEDRISLNEQKIRSQIAPAPKIFSYSQLETFEQCPLKYKYRYLLKILAAPSHALNFGQTIHRTLRDFHEAERRGHKIGLSELLRLYERHWIGEGYDSREHREQRFAAGKEMLSRYFESYPQHFGQPLFLEKKFKLEVGGRVLVGSIDRVDLTGSDLLKDRQELSSRLRQERKLSPGVRPHVQPYEIIDYKTGSAKKGERVDKDKQLTIYALAMAQEFGRLPEQLSLFFIEENEKFTTTRSAEDLEQAREGLIETIKQIEISDFPPQSGFLCQYCEYRRICQAP